MGSDFFFRRVRGCFLVCTQAGSAWINAKFRIVLLTLVPLAIAVANSAPAKPRRMTPGSIQDSLFLDSPAPDGHYRELARLLGGRAHASSALVTMRSFRSYRSSR